MRRIFVVEETVAGFDRQLAIAVHRVAGIDCKIEQSVLHLRCVNESVPQPACDDRVDLDFLAERTPKHVVHTPDEAAEIDHLGRERLAPAER